MKIGLIPEYRSKVELMAYGASGFFIFMEDDIETVLPISICRQVVVQQLALVSDNAPSMKSMPMIKGF